MIVIGLTGGIAMGKSTVATMLRQQGVPVSDADHEVHELIGPNGTALDAVTDAFPPARYPKIYDKMEDGTVFVNRSELGKIVFAPGNEALLKELEDILHPLVQAQHQAFIRANSHADIGVLDIPLLYETGGDKNVDIVMVVSAPAHIQRQRALARDNMTEEKFESILEKQMPDVEKRKRADIIIENGLNIAHSTKQVKQALYDLRHPKTENDLDDCPQNTV